MSSLTDIAYFSRQLAKYGTIFLLIFVISWSTIGGIIRSYRQKKLDSTPDTRYGLLPQLVFPQREIQPKNFTLELPRDSFPIFPQVQKVFVVYRPVSTLLALDQDTKTAQKMGFASKPVEIKTGVYQFSRLDSDLSLVVNVLEGSFTLAYPYQQDQLLVSSKNIPDKNQSIQIAKNFLSTADKMTADLESGKQVISYWSFNSQGIKKVSSYSEANAVRVDFFRQDIDNKYPIVSSKPETSSISVLLSGSQVDAKKVIEASYQYSPIDPTSYSRYPIIPPSQAYEFLKSGKYWPALQSQSENISIRNISLAYYEPSSLTNFMQPIYVFEGSQNFTAYVPAVDPAYMSQ